MKIIKRIALTLMAAAAIAPSAVFAASATGYEEGYNTQGSYIYDYNYMLEDYEIEAIDERIEETIQKTGLDICIVLNDEIEGGYYTYQDYADVFYEDVYGKNTDGVCLFVRFDPNYVHFSTSGKGQKLYNSKTDQILDDISPYLHNYNLTAAIDKFCDDLDSGYTSHNRAFIIYGLCGLILGIIVSVVVFFVVRSSYSHYAKSGSVKYIDQKNTKFTERNDVFIRQYTSKTRISSERSGSGGSGGHISSGGGSHGGGGRSF